MFTQTEDALVGLLGFLCAALALYLLVLVWRARDAQARRESVPLWLIRRRYEENPFENWS